MANWLKSKDTNQFKIRIASFKVDNYYAEYEISVQCLNNIEWRTLKRYSEFKKLNDELLKVDNKFKVYFPPKKSFNNMSSHFLNSRRKSLEIYLTDVVSQCYHCLPRCLAYFLEMDKYEIHGITTAMAKALFTYGNVLLTKNSLFEISVLLIHSINQRMSSPVPTNLYQKHDEDFGNVLDVMESLQKVKIVHNSLLECSADNHYGCSNIKVTSLTFDISIFASVKDLQMNGLEIANLRGLYKMNNTIEKLRVNFCLKSIEDLLFADFAYKESSIEHLQRFDGPLRCATDVDLSHNSIMHIDTSIVTLRQVQTLNLANNQISDINYMHYLTFLTELDLSYNNLHVSQTTSLSNKLGSIKKLILKGNKLKSLLIIDRMFSLEYLDVSENLLVDDMSLLSLCRLSCLESLIIKDNPICANPDFIVVIYDLFLDRYHDIKINGLFYMDIPLNIRTSITEYRATMKLNLFSERSSISHYSGVEQHCHGTKRNKLSSIDLHPDEIGSEKEVLDPDGILGVTSVFNIFIYWFFMATGKYIYPKKLLWVTEIFTPNRSLRPKQVLLATSGTHSPNVLKCFLFKWLDPETRRHVITIRPNQFMDLTSDFQHMIIGADKSFLRLDLSSDNRELYVCNNPCAVDGFICHLYHVDDGMASFGDSRIVHLNEEDRVEMMRRFVDVWRLDMAVTAKKNGENIEVRTDVESDFSFISRAMLQMKNGFQILLTVAVTQDILYLVDERIYDWPDFNKNPNLSSENSCSPYTSSCGQFPFLRTNAYFLSLIDICTEIPTTNGHDSLIDIFCPLFRYPVQITFHTPNNTTRDPLKLLFENEQKTHLLYQVIQRRCETLHPSHLLSSPSYIDPLIVKLPPSDIPAHHRYLNSSYSEIRLALSLSYPKLSQLATSSPEQVLSSYQTLVPDIRAATIYGMVWSKFIYLNFETDDRNNARTESPGLVCVCSSGIYVLYEMEDELSSEIECQSDPEADQQDHISSTTKYSVLSIDRRKLFKIHTGLNHQWLTLCCRSDSSQSESDRLVLIVRNKDLCKHILVWINGIFKDRSMDGQTAGSDESDHVPVENGHQESDTKELLYEIKRASVCGDIDLIHYCSLEDVRFDPAMPCQSLYTRCNDVFSSAIVVTTMNIALVRHNIGEYPIREFALGTIRQSPRHLQYQVLTVIPLFDCLQLQLPGHDRSVLIVVIRSSQNSTTTQYNTTLKIQLSITCQKEQKRLIDRLRQQRSKYLQIDTPLRVSVC